MATLVITNGTIPIGTVIIGKTLTVNDLQLYKQNPMCVGSSRVRGEVSGVSYNDEGLYTDAFIRYPGGRSAGYIITSGQLVTFCIFTFAALVSIVCIAGIEECIAYSVRLSERISDIS